MSIEVSNYAVFSNSEVFTGQSVPFRSPLSSNTGERSARLPHVSPGRLRPAHAPPRPAMCAGEVNIEISRTSIAQLK